MTNKEKLILGITGGSHLSVHALMLVLPSIFLTVQKEFSVGWDTLGYLAMLSAFMFGIGAIPTGYFESKIGGRNLLLIYHFGSIVSSLIIVFSTSLVWFAFGLAALGLFCSIYHPAGLTIISRRVKDINHGMAFHGIAGSIGLALGPLLTVLLTEWISWRAAYGGFALLNFWLALSILFIIPVRSESQNNSDLAGTETTNRSALAIFYGIGMLFGLSFAGFTTFMPTHFALTTRELISGFSDTVRGGLFTTFVLLAGIIGQIIGGGLGKKFQRANILFWIVVVSIPLLVLIGNLQGWALITVAIIFGIVHFAWQPVANSLIATLTHSRHRGIGYGINFFFSFGVGAFAAGVSGWIAEHFGVPFVFPAMAIVLLPAVILTYVLRRNMEIIRK